MSAHHVRGLVPGLCHERRNDILETVKLGAQRDINQFDAFVAAVDLAIHERADLFLVAGDLFDSNVQPRRSWPRTAVATAANATSESPTETLSRDRDESWP